MVDTSPPGAAVVVAWRCGTAFLLTLESLRILEAGQGRSILHDTTFFLVDTRAKYLGKQLA